MDRENGVIDDIELLKAEVERLRQGIWDACIILGKDHDGNDSPRHLVSPHLADLIVEEAQRMRADYDEMIDEDVESERVMDDQAAEIERLRADRDRWRKIADDFAEAGSNRAAHSEVADDYEKACHG